MSGPRMGFGYDLHRLAPGRALILGGVQFEHDMGLLGHSDADVICHALTDAILGAAAAGDIGRTYPPDDPKWKDASSLQLLADVWRTLFRSGYRFVNADVTVVAEAPKLAPRVPDMCSRLAAALEVDPRRISVKATTSEGLGPEGRCEAISAYAVCLLHSPDA